MPSWLNLDNKHNFSLRSYDFLWLSLALLPLLVVSFLLPLKPYDYWWYLRVGQETLQAGLIPQVDTLSFTRAGQPVVYHSWLAAVLLWLTYKAGGFSLTFLLRAFALGLTYGLVYSLNRNTGSGAKISALLTILAGLAGSNNWGVRPQILVYPLFLLALWILWQWQMGQGKNLWLLPLITLLWVNLHGSFPLFFVLAGTALLLGAGERKKLGFWFALSLAATLLNPRAAGVWSYVVNMLSAASNQQFSNEWAFPVNAGWQMNIFFSWLLLFGILAANSSRRLTRLEWCWYLGFGWMALSGVRYVIWFLLLIGPLTAILLSGWQAGERPPQKMFPVTNILLAGMLLLLPLALVPGLRERWWPDAPLPYDPVSTPVAAAEWLTTHPELPGPLWSDFGFSSYLDFALPSRPVWIDTRFEVYPVEQWQQYIVIARAEPGWEGLLESENINLLMVSPAGQPRLIEAVSALDEWCGSYRDTHVVIFARRASGKNCGAD